MLWIGTAALLLTVVEYLAHRRETMTQREVEVRNADSMETMEGEVSNALKRKLAPENVKVGCEDKVSLFSYTFLLHITLCLPKCQ